MLGSTSVSFTAGGNGAQVNIIGSLSVQSKALIKGFSRDGESEREGGGRGRGQSTNYILMLLHLSKVQ